MITNLKDSPDLVNKALHLIEESFEYQAPNSFLKDFAPLLAEENLHNCYVILGENQEIIAHIGSKTRQILINGNSFNITMLGGIAVSEEHRGSGFFQKLFTKVISDKKDETTFLFYGVT